MTESTHEIALLKASHRHDSPAVHSPADVVKKRSQAIEAAKDIVFGSTAGMAGKVFEYPFDTIKVRLQSSTRYSGPVDCFAQSIKSEGIAGLYRGISAPLLGAAVETSSLFFSYRLAQEVLQKTVYQSRDKDEPLPLSTLMFCGAVSGAVTSILLTPIELVKCQLQVPSDSVGVGGEARMVQRNPLTVIASIYKHRGFAGFWHGQLGTLIRETGGSAAWFGSYEGVSFLFREHWNPKAFEDSASQRRDGLALPIWQQMVAGASAGVSYNFLFYPADTIKSRMQTEQVGMATQHPRTNFWSVGTLLWREQGIKGLYRGCGITVARSAPASALIFTINETLRSWFK